jgi:hypothetical protein
MIINIRGKYIKTNNYINEAYAQGKHPERTEIY